MSAERAKRSAFGAAPAAKEPTTAPTPAPPTGRHPYSPQLSRAIEAAPPSIGKDAAVTAFATRLPPEMQRMIKIACVEQGIRMQDAVYEGMLAWLKRP